ncbi:carbonic anhydrase [Halovenus marina]|uniref:carbonic anhydrase n=1 Tax=Halovenus marina TaxID=3396621 RepID=UPI003F56D203
MNETLRELLAGNSEHASDFDEQFDHLQQAQRPRAVTVCCGDSRVLQDEMWHNHTPGVVFTHSNIGNRVRQETPTGAVVSGDVLYPLAHTGTETAIVVGHTGCGAVTAAYDVLQGDIQATSEPPGIEYCIGLLRQTLEPGFERLPADLDRPMAINSLVEYNVDRQIDALLNSPDVPDSVTTVGVVYDFQDIYGGQRGEVHVINVDGTRDPERLRASHPDIDGRIRRLWEY